MNPKYNSNSAIDASNKNDLSVFSKPLTSSFMAKELHDETINMFLQAARQNHLGQYFESLILFYSSSSTQLYIYYM